MRQTPVNNDLRYKIPLVFLKFLHFLFVFLGVGCGLTMVGLGTYMYYANQWKAAGEEILYTWIPLACIFIFTITCCLGFLVVPWVMIGELYPVQVHSLQNFVFFYSRFFQVRGIYGGLTTCSAHLFVFIVVKTYPFLYHHIEKYGVFLLYGAICLSGMILRKI